MYMIEKNNIIYDDYDYVVFIWNSSSNNILERRKNSKIVLVSDIGEVGMFDENNEVGVYNILNLCVFDYEELIKY